MLKNSIDNIFDWLKTRGSHENDPAELVIKKVSILIISFSTCIAAIVWAAVYYYYFGISWPTMGPVIYFMIVAPCLMLFFGSKKENLLINAQLFCIFTMPVMMEWTGGGFQSGVVICWAFLAPIGALIYKSTRQAVFLIVIFIIAVVITIVFDDFFARDYVAAPNNGNIVLYAMNIIGPSIVIYFGMQYFVKAIIKNGIKLAESKKIVEQTLEDLKREKHKSDELLLNILPAEVAEELKQTGQTQAHNFDNVSVLFTDFVNFTSISEKLSATELVAEIHHCFTAFDSIMEKYGIEKIKTIGDAYLAVCGLPKPVDAHAQKTVMAAKEIVDFINNRMKTGGIFNIRVGIHSGNLVAGIVGVKKFAYDIWGDTVNTAARMEQHSLPGKINISQSTFDLVKNNVKCLHRGKLHAKNKGEIDMYFVE